MDVPSLGARLRQGRLRRGLSLRRLAADVGVSASAISQIETGKSRPSVSTLYAMTTALGISLESLFAAESEAEPAAESVAESVQAAGLGAAAGAEGIGYVQALGSLFGQRLGPLVRPAGRSVLVLDSGVTWERLGQLPHQRLDFLLVTYDPGGTSSSSGALMRHPGSEYGFLLRGELEVTLGFDNFLMQPGDAISFDSSAPHRYRNAGEEPAVGVWFVTG
jgi:transcriptional regulator with XRE-family HTH domain